MPDTQLQNTNIETTIAWIMHRDKYKTSEQMIGMLHYAELKCFYGQMGMFYSK